MAPLLAQVHDLPPEGFQIGLQNEVVGVNDAMRVMNVELSLGQCFGICLSEAAQMML